MCGRYVQVFSVDQVKKELPAIIVPSSFKGVQNYNTSPTQLVTVVQEADTPVLNEIRWGLLPPWESDHKKTGLFNIRAETITEPWKQKPGYARFIGSILSENRCLFLANGFYEWAAGKPPRQPYFIYSKNELAEQGLITFAGLTYEWVNKNTGEIMKTGGILTRPANELLKKVSHDRMPVILDDNLRNIWLKPNVDPGELKDIVKYQKEAKEMNAFPVGRIGRENSPSLLVPAGNTVYSESEIQINEQLSLLGMGGRRNNPR
ncbi:SOS response-associated peptidase [Marinigracilibium pacificum]|uniref:Abasic site processing protein n=1 Tax=Marinigracilibium pacificum TaxID=2729599 RepID=A0A848J6K9_9BACT|nr:SOS response-associated peptidase [Marinigracilibium pacificum]NMM50019.1 SOS response-associated peptidase [Marinigracilibium pacificum]